MSRAASHTQGAVATQIRCQTPKCVLNQQVGTHRDLNKEEGYYNVLRVGSGKVDPTVAPCQRKH